MQLGPSHIQAFTSVVAIIGAAILALICDHLKRNNEQLRELAIELNARREEERRRQPPAARQAEKAIQQTVSAPAARALTIPENRKRTLAPAALAAMERGAQLAGAPRTRQPRVDPDSVEVISPAEVISPSKVVAAPAASARVTPRIRIRVPCPAQPPASRLIETAVAAQPAEPTLPAGFQDGYVLTRLVESHQPISGLVVSIGVSAPNDARGSLSGNVSTLIQSLIGPGDFAAQSGEEEFLLIYPGERGAAAQRRLSEVSQQLWDFQLTSLGNYSISFSWGGVEVRSESINEAIASATERMQETRRNRKVLTMESRPVSEALARQAM